MQVARDPGQSIGLPLVTPGMVETISGAQVGPGATLFTRMFFGLVSSVGLPTGLAREESSLFLHTLNS